MPIVYKLISPLTQKTYYVGFTEKSLTERLIGHMVLPKSKTTKDLIDIGLVPIIELIEEGENVTKETEMYWIKKLSFEGHYLENRDGLIVYQNKDYIFQIPEQLLNFIEMGETDRPKSAISIVLDELPLASSVPIIIRIKTILEWAISYGK